MGKKILAVGEALFDILPSGEALGGAPLNFAIHCAQLGADVTLLTRVGKDDLGRRIEACLRQRGVDTKYLQWDDNRPTGRVMVNILDNKEVEYEIVEEVAWDYLNLENELINELDNYQCLYFGTLAQRSQKSRETIQEIVRNFKGKIFLDLNLRKPELDHKIIRESIERTNILKLNLEEARYLQQHCGFSENISQWLGEYDLDVIILTQGERGTKWIDEKQEIVAEVPQFTPQEEADCVGAGDGVAAAVVVGYLRGMPPSEIVRKANEIGAYIASEKGATPTLPLSLKNQWLGGNRDENC
ncbi:MAG: carbohydrate kinase [Geminocystis sp.]|nr:carbohydrate kinase [Geminocystis sp.]MCS7149039.1 carbohydrate kinase [Geminocystis sp.]MDW8117116.1 carbohydrate kinase [Geminocystis sp.]MDW8462180.1 carbohydrate kinase [Geminocystis sp.]